LKLTFYRQLPTGITQPVIPITRLLLISQARKYHYTTQSQAKCYPDIKKRQLQSPFKWTIRIIVGYLQR
jgi:hypothetical protein